MAESVDPTMVIADVLQDGPVLDVPKVGLKWCSWLYGG